MTVIVALFCGCVGAILSVVCGFGLGIFTMMFLPHFMSSALAAPAVVSITSIFQAAWIACHYRGKIHFRQVFNMLAGYLIASAISIIFGKKLSNELLRLGLGAVLILLSFYLFFFSSRLKIKASLPSGILMGSIGGVMSALFGAGGPPASLYYSSCIDDKEEYLATIQTYFLISNIYVTSVRFINGIITPEVLKITSVSLTGMIIGTVIGKKIFDRMNAPAIRKAIYAIMALSGIIMIIEAVK